VFLDTTRNLANLATQDFAYTRYDHAYPYLINQDSRIGDPSGRKFQLLSCSSAIIQDMLDKQIPQLDDNQDAIILSIGESFLAGLQYTTEVLAIVINTLLMRNHIQVVTTSV
jgi:hypothetical protein